MEPGSAVSNQQVLHEIRKCHMESKSLKLLAKKVLHGIVKSYKEKEVLIKEKIQILSNHLWSKCNACQSLLGDNVLLKGQFIHIYLLMIVGQRFACKK